MDHHRSLLPLSDDRNSSTHELRPDLTMVDHRPADHTTILIPPVA
jgi:hypothetical protein